MQEMPKLTASEVQCLREAAGYPNGYAWRPRTCARLFEKGLLARSARRDGISAYFLTDAARDYLARLDGEAK